MIIYLDESKRIGKWEIVIGWFLSFHNTHYIEKFITHKKVQFDVPEGVELKSTNKFGRLFFERINSDEDFDELSMYSFGFHFDNYFVDSEDTYMNNLLKIFKKLFSDYWFDVKKVKIIQDNINISKNRVFENKINNYLRDNYFIKAEFKLRNSKNFLWLQLADLIVWDYKKLFFFDDIDHLEDSIDKKDIRHKKI